MSRKGVKVKELAGELQVSSRAIIDRCRAEGIAVQNSVTKLAPQVAVLVRTWFSPPAAGSESHPPTPPDSPDV